MRVVNTSLCIALLLLCCLASCNSGLNKEAYLSWIHDYQNGLRVQRIVGDYVLDLQHTPTDYVWLQRINNHATSHSKDSLKRELDEFQYYILTVSVQGNGIDFIHHEVESQEGKQKRLYYFSYLFQEDIQLEEDGQLLPCVLYHFERSSTLNGSRKIVLGFEHQSKASKEATVIITSDALGSLPIKLKVSKENIPNLTL